MLKRCRRSMLIVSGIVRIRRYPFAAQTKARAIPVFPLVGSMITVSLLISPAASAASIMATPILSFTLERGLKDSIFTRISAFDPFCILLRRTRGVFPTALVISANILAITFSFSILYFYQCLFDIGNDVVNMFDSYGQPDKIRCHTCRNLFLCGKLLVRCRCRVDRQGFCIAHIRQVRNKFQRFDELPSRFRAALDAESDNRPRAFR